MVKERIKIRHNRKLFFIIIILFILIILLFIIIKIKEGQEENKGECRIDADCVKQQVTCCSCNMGGIEECVSRKNASYWQNKLGECEKNIMCIALYNCQDISCKCLENKCVGS